MSALMRPLTGKCTGANATPAAAAKRAILEIDTSPTLIFSASCAGVGLLFTVPVTKTGVGPSLIAHLLMLSRSVVQSCRHP